MSLKRVLVVEDDREISDYVRTGLCKAGYLVEIASNGRAALQAALANSYSAIILDRMLPLMNGLEILSHLRARGVGVPVVLLTAVSAIDERMRGLSFGADDYITKPFHISEVVARLAAIERRVAPESGNATVLRYADIEANTVSRTVSRGGRAVAVNGREFSILRCLLENADKPVSRKTLLKEVWNYDFDPGTNVVDVHVSRVRTKLQKRKGEAVIKSVRGVGYTLDIAAIDTWSS